MFKKRLLPVCIAMAATGSINTYAQDSADASLEEEIVVTGVRNAELNARQSERNKNIFSSVIAQDDAGNFADQNVAESLQRLPGITLQKTEGEGRYVAVRDRKSKRLNSSHVKISYAVFCVKKKR